MEKYGTAREATDHNIIWRTRIACWITKATDTHSEYVIIVNFRRERNSALTFIRTIPVFLNVKPDGATTTSRLYRIVTRIHTLCEQEV